MTKKLLSIILSLSFALATTTAFAAGNENKSDSYAYMVESKFDDVSSDDWFHEAVAKCEDVGIICGYGDGNFGPNDPVTLQQVTLMTLRCYCAIGYGKSDVEGLTIPDKDGICSQDFMPVWASYQKGFLPGYYSGEEKGRLISYIDMMQNSAYREEALSCFYRMFANSGLGIIDKINHMREVRGINIETVENPSIPDYEEIDDLYKNDIMGAYKLGIAEGYDETGAFKPKNEITRAEFCQMMFESGIIETIYLQNKGLI